MKETYGQRLGLQRLLRQPQVVLRPNARHGDLHWRSRRGNKVNRRTNTPGNDGQRRRSSTALRATCCYYGAP
eukprot:contig_18988_g4685